MTKIKKFIYILLLGIIVLLVGIFLLGRNPKDTTDLVDTEQKINNATAETTTNESTTSGVEVKLIPGDTLCAQITKEFVTRATGVTITRVGSINDTSITACNYYLTDDSKSPYIVVVLNKNLSVEVQKTFYSKQKLDLITDSRIISNHIIFMDTKENRIAHIDLIIDSMNFIRIDKNVERAIDNEGLIKLAVEIAKRL